MLAWELEKGVGSITWEEAVELGLRQLLDVGGEVTVANHTAELLEK